MNNILEELRLERERQKIKWGQENHDPFVWTSLIGDKYGEINEVIINDLFNGDNELEEYRKKLIQTAAVCIAAIQSFDTIEDEWMEMYDDDDEQYEEWIDYESESQLVSGIMYKVLLDSDEETTGTMTDDGFKFHTIDKNDYDINMIVAFRHLDNN